MALRGADLVARSLARAGTRHVFALSGNHVMPVFDARYALETRSYEQIPLSHAIQTAGLFQSIDTRFNSIFYESMLVHYPYLHPDVLAKNTPGYELLAQSCRSLKKVAFLMIHSLDTMSRAPVAKMRSEGARADKSFRRGSSTLEDSLRANRPLRVSRGSLEENRKAHFPGLLD